MPGQGFTTSTTDDPAEAVHSTGAGRFSLAFEFLRIANHGSIVILSRKY